MNINQKIVSQSYTLIILSLFIINVLTINQINTQNKTHSPIKRNIFHELYQLYIPKKISTTQISTFCYTIFKIISVGISINYARKAIPELPYSNDDCFFAIITACLLCESIYHDYQNLYKPKITKPDPDNQNSDLPTDIESDNLNLHALETSS